MRYTFKKYSFTVSAVVVVVRTTIGVIVSILTRPEVCCQRNWGWF